MLSGSSMDDAAIKQLSVRNIYSFVDVDDSVSGALIDSLQTHEIGGQKLAPTKAITVNAPRPQEQDSDDDRPRRNDDQDGFEGRTDDRHADDGGSDESNSREESYEESAQE